MASTLLATVVLPALDGLARDSAVNTFTFSRADKTNEELADLVTPAIESFYNDSPGTDALATWMARSRDRTADACEIRYTDIAGHLNGTAAGPPFRIDNWTLGAFGTTDALPEEVAVALSFHGNLAGLSEFAGGARPKSRHRGRVFIGPLNVNGISTAGPSYQSRPLPALTGDIALAGQGLMDTGYGWSVWSRRNAAVYTVTGGWVDDAWDTIRGRGVDPTFKETFGSIV